MAQAQPLPEVPQQLKAIQGYMKVAADTERVNPIASYWVRLFCTDMALKIDQRSPECKTFLVAMMDWLERFKNAHKEEEAVTNSTVAQAHFENFVISLFDRADSMDRQGQIDRTTLRLFYMAALLFESMATFGPLTEEISLKAKYAKHKATYIQKCFKTGEKPVPGPLVGDGDGDGNHEANDLPTTPSSSAPSRPKQVLPTAQMDAPYIPEVPKLYIPEVPSNNPDTPGKSHSDSLPAGGGSQPRAELNETGNHSHSLNVSSISSTKFIAINGADLKPEDITQAQKHCKFVISALQYDDIPTAVDYLQKALNLLTTGAAGQH